jgi:hypothetical protein
MWTGHIGSRGALSGILLMWDRRVVEKIEDCVGNLLVACSFRSVIDNVEWAFAGVCGPNDDVERRYLWEELVGIMSWWELSWCIGGDFNVCFPCEKSGESRQSAAMLQFSEFIFDQGLVDIPLVGGNLTWSKDRDLQSWSRIDRFLLFGMERTIF